MTCIISPNHLTFKLKGLVTAQCKDFFMQTGLSYFQHMRCFNDGSISLLTNNTGLLEEFNNISNQPVVFSALNEKAHSYWFSWDKELPDYPVRLAREKYRICSGITLLKRSNQYYDMIGFAFNKDIEDSPFYYINKLSFLESFINKFEYDNKGIINQSSKNRIYLPSTYRDVHYDKICINNKKITVPSKQGDTYITSKELECLRALVHGCSYKSIALLLNISPRTVETYIQRIKQRTHLTSPRELEHLLFSATVC